MTTIDRSRVSAVESRRFPRGFSGRPLPGSSAPVGLAIACGVAALGLSATAIGAQDASGPWFTQEQADRGTRVFTIECGGCHGPTLTEVLADSQSAYAFYAVISGSMPWENPGALSRQQYADIIAYLMLELGFPAGETELPPDRDLLSRIVPGDAPAPATGATDEIPVAPEAVAEDADEAAPPVGQVDVARPETAPDAPEAEAASAGAGGYFTVAQADQGIRDFAIACGNCHGPDMVDIFQTYPTVADYFLFITGAMPNDDPGNLAPRQYLSVMAYLLRESGFPAGDTEFSRDLELMRNLVPASPPD